MKGLLLSTAKLYMCGRNAEQVRVCKSQGMPCLIPGAGVIYTCTATYGMQRANFQDPDLQTILHKAWGTREHSRPLLKYTNVPCQAIII